MQDVIKTMIDPKIRNPAILALAEWLKSFNVFRMRISIIGGIILFVTRSQDYLIFPGKAIHLNRLRNAGKKLGPRLIYLKNFGTCRHP
jgi:hypothetical protein